jgi:hypothetical protein
MESGGGGTSLGFAACLGHDFSFLQTGSRRLISWLELLHLMLEEPPASGMRCGNLILRLLKQRLKHQLKSAVGSLAQV